ncbi:MAG: hypothetical protein NTY48_07570 [Candidatus Diapherotrites archaeon]|nr:hypothetical protein [Candidatus Diapherotrites archaeon]
MRTGFFVFSLITASFVLLMLFSGCTGSGEIKFCGDGTCNGDETITTCPRDCGSVFSCGNRVCDIDENSVTCPRDCGNVACSSDADCSTFTTTTPECDGNGLNLVSYTTAQFCLNPGLVGSKCINNTPVTNLVEECAYGCAENACLPAQKITLLGKADLGNLPTIFKNRVAWIDSIGIMVYDINKKSYTHYNGTPAHAGFSLYENSLIFTDAGAGMGLYQINLDTNAKKGLLGYHFSSIAPRQDGNYVVYTGYDNSVAGYVASNYLYNLGTNVDKALPAGVSGLVSNGYIVWLQRDGVYAYNIKWENIAKHPLTLPSKREISDISGNKVVWTDVNNGKSAIFEYDLDTNMRKILKTPVSDQFNPVISGDQVAWLEGGAGIYSYDLIKGIGTRVTPLSTNVYSLDNYGKNIVYQTMDGNIFLAQID